MGPTIMWESGAHNHDISRVLNNWERKVYNYDISGILNNYPWSILWI